MRNFIKRLKEKIYGVPAGECPRQELPPKEIVMPEFGETMMHIYKLRNGAKTPIVNQTPSVNDGINQC